LVPMRQKVVPRANREAIAGFIRPPLQLGLVKPGTDFRHEVLGLHMLSVLTVLALALGCDGNVTPSTKTSAVAKSANSSDTQLDTEAALKREQGASKDKEQAPVARQDQTFDSPPTKVATRPISAEKIAPPPKRKQSVKRPSSTQPQRHSTAGPGRATTPSPPPRSKKSPLPELRGAIGPAQPSIFGTAEENAATLDSAIAGAQIAEEQKDSTSK